MTKNYLIVGVIIILVVGGVIFYDRFENQKAPTPASVEDTQAVAPKSNADGVVAAPPVQENVVIYTDAGYSPQILRVKAGTTVTFKNESMELMWTASAMHPTHTVYPTTGGCIGSTFDECEGDGPGISWQFKFDVLGTWKYHNHLNPSFTGTIIVE